MRVTEKPMPHNLDFERAILGVCLLNPSALQDAAILRPEDLFLDQNQRIYRALVEMQEHHRDTDCLTVTEYLERRDELKAAGGQEYIFSLIEGVPSKLNIGEYVKVVRKTALLRQLAHTAHNIEEAALCQTEDAEELVDRAAQSLLALAVEASESTRDGKSYKDAALSLLMSFSNDPGVRVFSGLTALDKETGGFRANEVVTLTAGTGVGKTLLAQQIRDRACQDGWHGLYACAEMNAEHLVARELATKAGVEHWKMRRPERLEADELARLRDKATEQCQVCHILDGELSMTRIRMAARRRNKMNRLGLVVLDYDELIDAPGKDELAQQRNMVRAAKSLATEIQCPVLMISQLRKSLNPDDAKKPTLERIYGSGAKSKHSSWIIFVDRQYVRELQGSETDARIAILKGRDGRVGMFPANFNLRTLRFDNAPEEPKEPRPARKQRQKETADQ